MYNEINSLKICLNILKFVIIIFICADCNRSPLEVESVIPCEYSYSDGVCEKLLDSKAEYTLNLSRESKVENYYRLSNFIYFKARYSAGFILKFNRHLNISEKESIKNTYIATYNFNGLNGEVERTEIGEDYIYSFLYLGSLYLEKQKEKKEDLKNFPKSFFLTFPIQFQYKSELFKGELETVQEIRITREQ